MAKGKKEIEYKQRLKELKIKLIPYRNKHTVNLLRVITGSSGVRLNNHFEALESVMDGSHSPHVVQTRIQSIVNFITNASHSTSIGHNIVKTEFERHNFNKTNVFGHVKHVEEIDSKAKVLGDVRHVNNDSKACVFGNFRHSDIDSKANVFSNVTHGNIASKACVFDNFRHSDIDSKANVFGNVTHGHIASKAIVFDNFRHSDIDSKSNVLGNVTHGNNASKASVFDNFRHSDIDSKSNVLGNVTHGNNASKASVFDNFRHSDIDSKAIVTHGNIGSNSNVGQGTIDLKTNTINRLQHLRTKE